MLKNKLLKNNRALTTNTIFLSIFLILNTIVFSVSTALYVTRNIDNSTYINTIIANGAIQVVASLFALICLILLANIYKYFKKYLDKNEFDYRNQSAKIFRVAAASLCLLSLSVIFWFLYTYALIKTFQSSNELTIHYLKHKEKYKDRVSVLRTNKPVLIEKNAATKVKVKPMTAVKPVATYKTNNQSKTYMDQIKKEYERKLNNSRNYNLNAAHNLTKKYNYDRNQASQK